MPIIHIPVQLQNLTNGVDSVDVSVTNVAQAIKELDHQFPGISARLTAQGEIRAGLAVAVDGTMSSRGLMHKLQPDSEVHFLPAIGGG